MPGAFRVVQGVRFAMSGTHDDLLRLCCVIRGTGCPWEFSLSEILQRADKVCCRMFGTGIPYRVSIECCQLFAIPYGDPHAIAAYTTLGTVLVYGSKPAVCSFLYFQRPVVRVRYYAVCGTDIAYGGTRKCQAGRF
eukprot:3937336-Rhodomonas_salina.1